MEKLMVLFLFCCVASAVKHFQTFNIMISSGHAENTPEYFIRANFEEVGMAYYDTSMETLGPIHDWARNLTRDDPQHWEKISEAGIHYEQRFRVETESFKQSSNQTGGVDIIQQYWGCEWDEATEKTGGCLKYGYNGGDFLTFDLETETWIAANPQAEITKKEWDRDAARNVLWKNLINKSCPEWLKKYFFYTNRLLEKQVLPSVSLLQKSPSSPVTCHATGFYPNKAMLLWRKDGEELHEDVEGGEVLPNHDGSFQMSVDLHLSSVQPEDWGRYDCVFQLSGVNQDTVTKLDRAVIRTNWGDGVNAKDVESSNTTVHIIVAVVAAVVIISIIGLIVYQRKKVPDNNPEDAEARKTLRKET